MGTFGLDQREADFLQTSKGEGAGGGGGGQKK